MGFLKGLPLPSRYLVALIVIIVLCVALALYVAWAQAHGLLSTGPHIIPRYGVISRYG